MGEGRAAARLQSGSPEGSRRESERGSERARRPCLCLRLGAGRRRRWPPLGLGATDRGARLWRGGWLRARERGGREGRQEGRQRCWACFARDAETAGGRARLGAAASPRTPTPPRVSRRAAALREAAPALGSSRGCGEGAEAGRQELLGEGDGGGWRGGGGSRGPPSGSPGWERVGRPSASLRWGDPQKESRGQGRR